MDFFVFLPLEPDSYNVFQFFSKMAPLKKNSHIYIYAWVQNPASVLAALAGTFLQNDAIHGVSQAHF